MRRTHGTFFLVTLFFAMSAWGCQIVGGHPGELELADGGSGGEGGTGLPVREPRVWDSTMPGPGPEMYYTLPEWLLYQAYGTTRTSEVSPGVIRLGFTTTQPRSRNIGNGAGLLLEPVRTNYVTNSGWTGAGWESGSAPNGAMMAMPGILDPAGTMAAVQFVATSDQQSSVAHAQGRVASTWVLATSSSNPAAYFAYGDSFVPIEGPESSWTRYDVVRKTDDPGDALRLETQSVGGAPAIMGASTLIAYGAQVEEGLYPSSLIPTKGAPVQRKQERLYMQREVFAPLGYFDVTLRFAPHYATSEQSADHDYIALQDDNVIVRMRPPGILIMFAAALDGDLRIEGLTWERNQILEIRARYLANRREITITGATAGNGTIGIDGPVPPITVDPIVWFLGNEDGPQEGVDLKYLWVR